MTQPGSESAEDQIGALAEGDAPLLETLAQMSLNTLERSGLDLETYTVARVAALVAMDAAPVSYLLNLGTAADLGVPLETVRGTLVAIAPVVGSARIVSAASKMVRALGLAMAADDLADDVDDEQ
jgi:4-carboxymuconolactone decarboxylase